MIFNLRFRSVVRIGYREAGPKRSDVATRLGAMIEQTAGVGGTIGCLDRIRTGWLVTPGVPMLPKFVQGLWRGGPANVRNRETSVMIEKVAGVRGTSLSEFLDLDHTGEIYDWSSFMIAKFARDAGGAGWRTSGSGH